MSEKVLQNQILQRIGSHPKIRVMRQNTGALTNMQGRLVRFGIPGCSDIIGIIAPSGRWLAVEVKSPIGKQSEQQKNFQAMIEAFGGIYVLARSIEPVIESLRKIGIEI